MAAIAVLMLSGLVLGQDQEPWYGQEEQPSLGDIARQERARKEAVRAAAGPEIGGPPPLAVEGELIPAYFLSIQGGFGAGDYVVSLNGRTVLKNSFVPGLPIYVAGYLRDGGNVLQIEFVSHATEPLEITIEERYAGASEHSRLAHFQSAPNQFTSATKQQISFTARPRAIPNVQITDEDRTAILKLIQSFYDALSSKNGQNVMKLFQPALRDAQEIYPEGAEYGRNALLRLAHVVGLPGFSMNHYDPAGLTFRASGNVVNVSRTGDTPVFLSNEVTAGVDGSIGASRVNADIIPVKKIGDEWRLTLPFGF
ncbi:MAG TPA: hypothetical protein VN577_19760 [Terriglobales bacterium]|nr:hypothetical protein [Terriglobales bacterium]